MQYMLFDFSFYNEKQKRENTAVILSRSSLILEWW